jgi:hypothetical protein
MPEENITIDEYSYYTRRQDGAEKSSENYLLDMLQVVVHAQIKKQHNVLPTNPCIRIMFKYIQLIIV